MNTNTISTTVKKYTVAILITSQFILSFGVATATTTPEIVPDDNQSTEPEATEEAVGLDVDYETDSDGEVLVDSEAPAIGSEDASASSSVEIDSIAEGAGVSNSEGDISETGQSSSTTESSNTDIEDSMTTATGSSSTEENVASTTNQALASSTDIILEESISAVEQLTYKKLMKRYNEIAKDRDGSEPETSALADDLNEFVAAETSRLEDLGVAEKRIKQYVDSLTEKQIWLRDKTARDPNWLERSISKVKNVFGLEKKEDDIQIPKNLPTFEMVGDENILLEDITYTLDTGEEGVIERVIEGIKAFFVTEVEADTASLPVIGDIATSTGPSASNYKIHELAIELDHNPVNIYNYLKNNFEFESYYGALKGADGCLADMVCNDVDLTALAISLYRESGIPARYKKVEAVINPEQMADLIGTQDVNTALQTLFNSGYFAGITAGTYDPEGTVLETDLSGVTQVVVEWMIPQIFVSYDATGGNYSNSELRNEVLVATSTDSLRNTVQAWKDGQWIDAETFLVQSRAHTVATEVVPESFDIVSFWESYLEYTGSEEPYEKFYDDLTASTSKDITEAQYQTSMVINVEDYSRIPVTSRFLEGTVNEDPVRETEYFSDLSGVWLPTVEYRLIDRDTEDEVFSFETEAHLMDEVSGDLFYTGETSTDISTIESYGGIAQTPATLVSIIPVLTLSDGTYVEGSEGLTIGQQLIFEIIFDPKHDDPKIIDKFATAGNDEGVYVAFSKISENPDLDNSDDPDQDSKILLKGNSEIVRQYFKRLQEERALYTRAFNIVEIPTIQAGTITQTRILEEDVNGFPTTFEFSGLGLNAFAKVVLSDRNKDQDQRVSAAYLTGLAYSDYEGQVFDDITGLSGIATIQGFQYAHASSSYTVYKIIPDDRSDLSNLNLSSTTIENMDDALDQGRIVYTPDNLIVDGEWRGIVYITVDPETGSATYAIGEQVQNGGWTKDGFQEVTVTVGGKQVGRFKNEGSSKTYVFGDSIGNGLGSINCRISNNDFTAVLNTSGYQSSYGLPCLTQERQFGNVDHEFIVTTDAAKFISSERNYNYWVTAQQALNVIQANTSVSGIIGESVNGAFKFNVGAGTYSQYGSYLVGSLTSYYEPTSNGNGDAHVVYGDMLNAYSGENFAKGYFCSHYSDYCKEMSQVVGVLGYPTSDQDDAATYGSSWFGTSGRYQEFAGGQIYKSKVTAYVYGAAVDELNAHGGSAEQGFPIQNPYYDVANDQLVQEFLSGWVITQQGSLADVVEGVVSVNIQKGNSLLDDEAFLEGFYDAFTENGFTGIAVDIVAGATISEIGAKAVNAGLKSKSVLVQSMAKKLAGKTATKFVPVIGWVVGGYAVINTSAQIAPLVDRCNEPGVYTTGARTTYWCGKALGHGALIASGAVGNLAADGLSTKYLSKTDAERARKMAGNGPARGTTLANINSTISRYSVGATFVTNGTGAYSSVFGHHVFAKRAFVDTPIYNQNAAFAIANAKIDELAGFTNAHSQITGNQLSLYMARGNELLTIDEMADIEYAAMTNPNVGIPTDVAKGLIVRGLQDLKSQGVPDIVHIPWVGPNPLD